MVPVSSEAISEDIFIKTLYIKDFQRLSPRLIQSLPQPIGDGFRRPNVYKPKSQNAPTIYF